MKAKLIVALYDIKANLYSPPSLADTPDAARRMFVDLAHDSKTLVGMHPEDFELMHVGDYDMLTGDVLPAEHRLLFVGKSLLKEQA